MKPARDRTGFAGAGTGVGGGTGPPPGMTCFPLPEMTSEKSLQGPG
jgi:hypothetical protein